MAFPLSPACESQRHKDCADKDCRCDCHASKLTSAKKK